jgi:hypothetical protein
VEQDCEVFCECSLIASSAGTVFSLRGEAPEQAAKEWIQAIAELDGSKINALACSELQVDVEQVGIGASGWSLFGQVVTGRPTEIDVSGLRFETIRSDVQTATVRVSGEVRTVVQSLSQSQTIDQPLLMVKEDGKWKVCGS